MGFKNETDKNLKAGICSRSCVGNGEDQTGDWGFIRKWLWSLERQTLNSVVFRIFIRSVLDVNT